MADFERHRAAARCRRFMRVAGWPLLATTKNNATKSNATTKTAGPHKEARLQEQFRLRASSRRSRIQGEIRDRAR
jgi:hypothetical protein